MARRTAKKAQRQVGASPPRAEGVAKLTGAARYIDDVRFPEMLHGVTVRSHIARGIIRSIEFAGPVPWDEIVVVTGADVPGKNFVGCMTDDQPFLAESRVNHAEEPILLLAHADRYVVEEARKHVRIDIEPLPPVLGLPESAARAEVIWGNDNILKRFRIQKGDVEKIWKHADFIVEGDYETGAQEQLYIENNGVIAVASPEAGVTVWGSLQCPYYIHKPLMALLGLPPDKVRIIQTETGGGFGGKEEYPTVLAGHAALLAWKSGKPVKMIYSRDEDMAATTKRHPSRSHYKTALDRNGKMLALDIQFTLDGGAYMTLSPVVLSRGALHAAGPYHCENVRILGQALATNHPPHGAFRGFGAPQSIFALERHMDKCAHACGLSPAEFRRLNAIHEGQKLATGQIIKEKVDYGGLLDRAMKLSSYREKRAKFPKDNEKNPVKKGIGLAMFMHGAGFTGAGEKHLASVVGLEATAEGRVRVLSASTEIGQGTNTIFRQIVADALSLPSERIDVATPDTRDVPNSGPTVASRTCMVVGGLLEQAAINLKQLLISGGGLDDSYDPEGFAQACASYIKKVGPLKTFAQYRQPVDVVWDEEKYVGDAYATYAWAVYVAEVSVDTRTWETRVDDFVALQEVGKVVHPILAAGQIEGGVAQGIGFALYEKVVYQDGHMRNNQMTNYIVPTAMDTPPIRVYFEEKNRRHGPGGAKGIGELPMDGPAPAILAAIENATGIAATRVPLLPEDLLRESEKVKR